MGWSIDQEPTTPDVPVTVQTRSASGKVFTQGVSSVGLSRPLRRDGKSDFASESGPAVVAANIGQILGTSCSGGGSVGELPWRTEFGCRIHALRLRGASSVLAEQAKAFVVDAIQRWEPRAKVSRISARLVDTKLIIDLQWQLVASGDSNRVVVSGLETTVAVG